MLVVSIHEVGRRGGSELHLVGAHLVVVGNQVSGVRVLFVPVFLVDELVGVDACVVHHLELFLVEVLQVGLVINLVDVSLLVLAAHRVVAAELVHRDVVLSQLAVREVGLVHVHWVHRHLEHAAA